MDPTVADRVVVVSALGGAGSAGSVMGWPNGELDAWADWIVGQRFRYIQVNGYYDQLGDVTGRQGRRPARQSLRRLDGREGLRPFIRYPMSSDQIGVLAVGIPTFVTARSGARSSTPPRRSTRRHGPPLLAQADGSAWVVSDVRYRDGG